MGSKAKRRHVDQWRGPNGEFAEMTRLENEWSLQIYSELRELHLVDQIRRQPSGKPDYRWAKAVATASDA